MRRAAPLRLGNWSASEQRAEEMLDLAPVRRLLALLDDTQSEFAIGDALPALWNWLYFLDATPMRGLGPDGHPAKGGFMPPIDLPQRLFAGLTSRTHRPLSLGRACERRAHVAGLEIKAGRDGPLAFVTVHHEYWQDGACAIEEDHRIVYRARGTPRPAPAIAPAAVPPPALATRTVGFDAVQLFRFSSLTGNAHRIHYDADYARQDEGYPALVVHAPLVALTLLEFLRAESVTRPSRVEFHARAPLYCGQPMHLQVVDRDATRWTLRAVGCDGAVAFEGAAQLE